MSSQLKPPGANVATTKSALTANEGKILKTLYEKKGTAFTAKNLAGMLSGMDIRQISASLSVLVGLDLVISTEFRHTLSDVERNFWKTTPEPFYYIRNNEADIYHRRVFNVLESCNGQLHNLEYIQPQTKDLWPCRPVLSVTFPCQIQPTGDTNVCRLIGLTDSVRDFIKTGGIFKVTLEHV